VMRQILATRPEKGPACPKDSSEMGSEMGGSTSVVETLDNGIMPRKVERYRDIEDLRRDHSKAQDIDDGHIV